MSEQALKQLEVLSGEYARANEDLAGVKQALHLDVERIREKYKLPLKGSVDAVVATHEKLKAVITDNPELFVKPKTRTVAGVKVGFRKGTDELVYKVDEDTVIDLIKTEIPRKKKLLIKTTEKLVKPAVKELSGDELKVIQCLIEQGDDIVFIKTADDEIDKFINSLTKDLDG